MKKAYFLAVATLCVAVLACATPANAQNGMLSVGPHPSTPALRVGPEVMHADLGAGLSDSHPSASCVQTQMQSAAEPFASFAMRARQ